MAKALASAFAAPLVASTVSRLLIDLNRSIGHPQLFSAVTRAAPAQTRAQIVEQHYRPYRAQVERLVRQAVSSGHRLIHISSHTFTAELDGRVRSADVGLLYHPGRRGEAEVCARWKESLAAVCSGTSGTPQLPLCRQRRRVDLALAPALRAERLRRNRTGSQPGHRFRRRPTLDGVAAHADRFVTHGMCGLSRHVTPRQMHVVPFPPPRRHHAQPHLTNTERNNADSRRL